MIRAKITYPQKVADLFVAEEKTIGNDRSGYEVSVEGNMTVFSIFAKDATSLRTIITSITKILNVIEQVDAL
ncbi:MAG: hypothetical protein H6502_00905 [Candidatus Woesearchaeota archaeon]|nr:MAG: hypothetical protein H6502_00905 [Candidatus Woesearchaeota archaeon]